MEALLINVGTLVAIAGLTFSLAIFAMVALVLLDTGKRWFR